MRVIKSKLRVVELYAGTGRSIEPYRDQPEFEVALLADISHKAREVYLANHPNAPYALIDLVGLMFCWAVRRARASAKVGSGKPTTRATITS
jgi:site-specific DNA-cytosine methylase